MINNMMSSSWLSKLLLLASISGIISADDVVHRLRTPHDNGRPQGVITTRDDYGNLVEVVASTSQHQEEEQEASSSPRTPLPLLHPQQTRIVNGTAPDKGDAAYPFFVQLQYGGGWNFCGGQLIAPNVVLTAAHCVYDKEDFIPPEMSIWNGIEMQKRIPESGVIHPNYQGNKDDIALIKLAEPALPVNEVNDGNGPRWELVADDYDWVNHPPIIRLQRYQTPSGCTSLYSQGLAEDILTLTVIGHGRTSFGGGVPGELLEADVHYVRNSVCNEQYGGISDDMLCAADTDEVQDACQGDSGGPLFTRLHVGENSLFTLVGVVSWGIDCAHPEFPGVYSRVAQNTEWIDAKVCGDLSPKSCTADGKIRDYAVESLAGGTSVSRRTKKNRVKNDRRADLYGEQLEEELCELLGSNVDEEISSLSPSSTPSELPTPSPSSAPSELPTLTFSSAPSALPSLAPSSTPSQSPTRTQLPSSAPSEFPTQTHSPSSAPSQLPTQTHLPSLAPSELPTRTSSPSSTPSELPTQTPSSAPSELSSNHPSLPPSSPKPSTYSTDSPSITSSPSHAPIIVPTVVPSVPPSRTPSTSPSGSPSVVPSVSPSSSPSKAPIIAPSVVPSVSPSSSPSKAPIIAPSVVPSVSPSLMPSAFPSSLPSVVPSMSPSISPSQAPVIAPSIAPSMTSSISPSQAPTTSPSMAPSVTSSLMPSTLSSVSPTWPLGRSPTMRFTTNRRWGKDNAKGLLFEVHSSYADFCLEKLAFRTKDNKATNVNVYFKLGSYQTFPKGGRNRSDWGMPVFSGVPYAVAGGFREVEFDEDKIPVIPEGLTGSFYIESKKEIMFVRGRTEFARSDGSTEMTISTGSAFKKAFDKKSMNANFVGVMIYHTYREVTRVTSTPSLSASLPPSELPSLPPSMSPSNLPSLPPSSPRPSTSSSPSQAPIIAPSVLPSVTSSLMPSTFPSDSPSLPPRTSPTRVGINIDRNANQKANGYRFQIQAKDRDVVLEKMAFRTKDNKPTNVKVYFEPGPYQTFPKRGRNRRGWGVPIYNGVPYRVAGGYREAAFNEAAVIPKGGTGSFYLESRKDLLFVRGRKEFAVSEETEDFNVLTGSADKKPFDGKRTTPADFVGEVTYYTTYRKTEVVSSSPSLSPSTSEPPVTVAFANYTTKEYTTPDIEKAKDDDKGVMFSITAKSKGLNITGLGILGEDNKKSDKESDLWIYYQDGLYKDFNASDESKWIEVFSDEVKLDPDKLVDIELADDISIPANETVSLYIVSKKGITYKKSRDKEFDIYEGNDDLAVRVGTTTKKEFQQPEKLAEFAGRINYQS